MMGRRYFVNSGIFVALALTLILGLTSASVSAKAASGNDELAPTFVDVPFDHPYHDYIEVLYQEGYTAGCSLDPLMYCPEKVMSRAESSVFVERGIHGAEYDPPDPMEVIFADVELEAWYADWVQGLWDDGYTSGCETDPLRFCPDLDNTRAEATVFYLRMMYGSDYQPPASVGSIFTDVDESLWYYDWVNATYEAGIAEPCATNPELRFCPDAPLTRADAAYMMVEAKVLTPSGNITITANNQIVQNKRITSMDGSGISCSGYSNIIISNVIILFDGVNGIYLNGCDGANISNVNLLFTGAPETGPNNNTEHNCIEAYNSNNLVVNNVLATDCSSGVYTIKSDAPSISLIKCINMRGPHPRGQCVQFNQSNNFSLSDFYSYNDLNIAWTSDNISVYQSSNGIIQRGVIDGNNRTNGSGVAIEDSSSNVTVSDVDVYNWCNCAFGASNGTNISFIRVRASDSYKPCTQGVPASSTGIAFISYNFKPSPPTVGTIFSHAQYFNLASGNQILYDGNPSTIAIDDIVENNFTKLTPIVPLVPSID